LTNPGNGGIISQKCFCEYIAEGIIPPYTRKKGGGGKGGYVPPPKGRGIGGSYMGGV